MEKKGLSLDGSNGSRGKFVHDELNDNENEQALGGPRVSIFYKLLFPIYDGKEDLLHWLNRCEQFFKGHQTMEEKVWLASYHMTGAAQHWYYRLERN